MSNQDLNRNDGARPNPDRERIDVVVIGGGQAGLSVGYYLAQRGIRFVILDAEARIGDVWRRRWASLRLFTPARFDALVGMPFPAHGDYFPTKDEMADYLEAYARQFALPVRSGMRVRSVTREAEHYLVRTDSLVIEAKQVVVAMASYQRGKVPDFARELDPKIVQLHSSEYRGPTQLARGPVLIAGAGNSGAEIAMDLRRDGLPVLVAGRDTGEVPFRIGGFLGRWFLTRLVLRFVFHRLLTIRTPMGRKARPNIVSKGGPLIRTRKQDLLGAGVERTARVTGVRDGKPVLGDGQVLDVANIVWCTGFHPGLSFVELPIFDEHGEPRHEGGVVPSAPGLYFVGLHFLYAMSSTMIHGVSRDAARIAGHVARALRAEARPAPARRAGSAARPAELQL